MLLVATCAFIRCTPVCHCMRLEVTDPPQWSPAPCEHGCWVDYQSRLCSLDLIIFLGFLSRHIAGVSRLCWCGCGCDVIDFVGLACAAASPGHFNLLLATTAGS